jgi:hypothetical protein
VVDRVTVARTVRPIMKGEAFVRRSDFVRLSGSLASDAVGRTVGVPVSA